MQVGIFLSTPVASRGVASEMKFQVASIFLAIGISDCNSLFGVNKQFH